MSRPPRLSGLVPAAVGALCLALLATGCRETEDEAAGPPPLVTEEIGAPPDALVRPEDDAKEVRRTERVSGVLPTGFPASFPLLAGLSVTDFGDEGGSRWVELTIAESPAAVRQRYAVLLRGEGWRQEGQSWSREGTRVGWSLEPFGPSTRIRLTY